MQSDFFRKKTALIAHEAGKFQNGEVFSDNVRRYGSEVISDNAQSGLDLYMVKRLIADVTVRGSTDVSIENNFFKNKSISIASSDTEDNSAESPGIIKRIFIVFRKFLRLRSGFLRDVDSAEEIETKKTKNFQVPFGNSSSVGKKIKEVNEPPAMVFGCTHYPSALYKREQMHLVKTEELGIMTNPSENPQDWGMHQTDVNAATDQFLYDNWYQQQGDDVEYEYIDVDIDNQKYCNDSGNVLLCSMAGKSERNSDSSSHDGVDFSDLEDSGSGLFAAFRNWRIRKRKLEFIITQVVKAYPLISEEELFSLISEPYYHIDYKLNKATIKRALTRLKLNSGYERFRHYVRG